MSELHTRKEKRTPVTLKIKFKSATLDQFIERYSVDVSHGGIFIRTKDPLAVGTQLRFEFQLQDASPLISGDGTVVWTREFDPSRVGVAPGMGVRFDRLAPESQPVLEQILDRKSAGRAEERFEGGSGSLAVSEKTRITPPNLASSLVAQARQPSPPERSAVPRTGTLAPPRAGFGEEARDNTPLPKPMPFHVAADDEFSEDVFDQPTKVASLESLLRHEEEHARAQAESARHGAAPVAEPPSPDEDEQTAVAAKPTKPRTRPLPAAQAAPPAQPAAEPTDDSIDAPTPAVPRPSPAQARPVSAAVIQRPVGAFGAGEPRFLESLDQARPEAAAPLATARPAPADTRRARRSPLPMIIGAVVVLLAAAAAVYIFVIRPGAARTPPAPALDQAAKEPATGPTTPAHPPAPAPIPASAAPAPAPAAPAPAPKVAITVETRPAGARVSLDGAEPAAAPLKATVEADRKHAVVASAACYRDQKVEIDPSKTKRTVIKLKPLERVVRVTTKPASALVIVDGKTAGHSPTDVRLVGRLDPKKPHTFAFRKAGYKEGQVVVAPDAPCATDGDLGVVGLEYTLTQLRARPVAPRPREPKRTPKPKPEVVKKPAQPAPVETKPTPAQPETTKPAPAQAETPAPEAPNAAPKPTPAQTEPGTPEATTPEAGTPEATTPETTTPEVAKPEAAKPEAAKPETAKPETTKPETTKPEAPTAPATTPPAAPQATPPKEETKPESTKPPAPAETPPKAETPKEQPKPAETTPKAAPKPESKDCDPSPDAPDWARCK